MMKFQKKKKKNIKKTHNIAIGTLYDINKNLIEKNVEALSEEELQNKKTLIIDFINEGGKYFMLLCNDRKDYTLFNRRSNELDEYLDGLSNYTGDKLENVLIDECLPNRGRAKSIELTENKDAIEIWISIDGNSYCYYFFPYDNGVIEC